MKRKIIAFMGIDGSGKTTHVDILYNSLQRDGVSAKRARQLSCNLRISSLLLKKLAPILKKLERGVSNKSYFNQTDSSSSKQSFFRTFLRICAAVYTICTGFYRTVSKIALNKSQVIIFDRYFYDDILKAKWMFGLSDRIEQKLMNFIPSPSLLFYLDLPVEQAWARLVDRDITVEQHRMKKETYDEWFERMEKENKNFVRINADRDVELTHRTIREYAMKELKWQ